MSPIAYTPGSVVSIHSFVMMKPRSGMIFVLSRPMSAVRGDAADGDQHLLRLLRLRLAVLVGPAHQHAVLVLLDLACP